jgi:hypothetical protein
MAPPQGNVAPHPPAAPKPAAAPAKPPPPAAFWGSLKPEQVLNGSYIPLFIVIILALVLKGH